MTTPKKTPATTIRKGTIKAAIWENTGKNGTFYNITFTNSFKTAEGKWKNTNSYTPADLERLLDATFAAQRWIMRNSR
jgi:hypothetical protein